MPKENILPAYRNIKSNTGSNTAGTDKLTVTDIGKLTPEEVSAKVNFIISRIKRCCRPKPVRRKDIPKSNGKLIYLTKGTPQGGIISLLLANIVLNELDHWVKKTRVVNVKRRYSEFLESLGQKHRVAQLHPTSFSTASFSSTMTRAN